MHARVYVCVGVYSCFTPLQATFLVAVSTCEYILQMKVATASHTVHRIDIDDTVTSCMFYSRSNGALH